jgi:hypothetical protein
MSLSETEPRIIASCCADDWTLDSNVVLNVRSAQRATYSKRALQRGARGWRGPETSFQISSQNANRRSSLEANSTQIRRRRAKAQQYIQHLKNPSQELSVLQLNRFNFVRIVAVARVPHPATHCDDKSVVSYASENKEERPTLRVLENVTSPGTISRPVELKSVGRLSVHVAVRDGPREREEKQRTFLLLYVPNTFFLHEIQAG